VLETCRTPSQIRNAENSLKWINAFVAWDLKAQSELFSQNFIVWHSSLSALAAYYKVNNPNDFAKLPFPDGKLTRANYSMSLAFLAFANDKTKWSEVPTKIDCIDDHTVSMDISFSGYQVKRDAEGYILYAVKYSAPAVKVFTIAADGKVALQTVALDSATSTKARMELAELVKKGQEDPVNYPPMPRDENSRGTFGSYYQEFQKAFSQ
jgi:hypothetical protein